MHLLLFSGGRPGAVPFTPSPEFSARIAVSARTHTHTHTVEGECVSVCLPLQMGNVLMTFLRSRSGMTLDLVGL